jgi:hypothetical protein
MSHVFKRYDVEIVNPPGYYPLDEVEAPDGEWVKAQDAYDKVAVLEAQIATLKAQLKEARK